uniref:Helicase C-terminal domain-containing protein n=1 Tax=Heterorhabditis bacteriophora TaxID=37862 RepID=A0A1I7XLJ1_HETBA
MAGYDPHNRMFNTGVTVCSLYQGGNINGRRNITQDIVIAVPQSVLNRLDEESIDLSKLHLLIIDEADKMVDDMRGFGREIIRFYKKSSVIFVEKKITCNYLACYLQQKGYDFLPLNGDYDHEYVSSTLSFLKSGSIQGVVATNKLARGQDIPDVDHVIVFEMAEDFNDYCHRIGRTGRIGRGGRATVLLSLTNITDIKHIPALVKAAATLLLLRICLT